ncbi:MAG: Uma2 family endonuclease [Caldilineaceae bacterium]|nr:Uma2 family endonuclease [Caldilineaceae bacterium]MDE0630784.1 Uma2 family endonuclease [Caldilineaceae bacterium]
MLNVKTRHTYADYLKTSDDERYELLNGELVMVPSPREIHQSILGILYLMVGTFVRDRGLGKVYFAPFDVVLSDTDVVQPDLLFISNERAERITQDNVRGAPDLVVEILSPATAERDRTLKLDLYATHGVKEYWIVDPGAQTITVLLRGESGFEVNGIYGEGQTMRSPTLEEFSVALEEIF